MAQPGGSRHPMVFWFKPWMMIAFLAVAHILFSALVNPFGPPDTEWNEYLGIGAWYAQPMMFGLWLALGSASFSTRFQLTLLAFALLLFAGAIIVPRRGGVDPDDHPIRVAMFVVTAIVMLVIRKWTGWRIARETDREINARGPVRFNIKSLLVWTAFLAAMLALGRYMWPAIGPLRLGPLDEIALVTFIFALVFGPLVFVSLSLLSRRLLSGLTVAAFSAWPVAVFVGTLVLEIVGPAPSDTVKTFFLVSAGGALACCLTVLPLRLIGYRLTRPTS
jgi:hypothetical protein